ncbi:nuclear transport factor 2 family protein [Mucilaginibacter aquaedulcis]|uniref:nuclear transport factor 2 family protein n=1 Tax=Mucilaginibacter aquaedulcis TaxID=1187081 RepID=UPI0025B4698D|nr:nuclear transport factor 2 family protein [Mucilaginibacter aquaedulcis]MDN3551417.1 nuclear transport factor 2 family protein [Mucilaginibacter aquaedulcis]
MKKLITLIVIMILSVRGYAQQTDQDAIKQTINTMFDAMRKGDSTLLRSTFAKGIAFQGVANKKDGSVALETENADDFIKAVGTPHKGVWDEQVIFKDIKIDGPLSSVWAPYKFYLDKTFSHCGVDVFQLMKTKDGWKIIYIVDTRRKDNCPE